MSDINPNIFREYDIRGIADTDLNEKNMEELSCAIASFFISNSSYTLIIGHDCRLSSERLKQNLIKGLINSGIKVIDIGMVPTPCLYFSLFSEKIPSGIMITGSHNPPEYNGLKLCLNYSTIYGKRILEIKDILERKNFKKGTGSYTPVDIKDKYIQHIFNGFKTPFNLKLGVDCGNGVAGLIVDKLFNKLGCDTSFLYIEPDGNFPNHHPDPTIQENLTSLKKLVLEKNLNLGIAFDGDADRIGVVDSSGKTIFGDELLVIYARDVLEKNPGAKILSEVKASNRLFNDIRQHGGKPIIWKTGHSLIKAKMLEENILLAGEMSGHMFFKDRYFGFDDAIYAAARLLEIVNKYKKSPSELISDLPKTHYTPEIRIPCPDKIKFKVIQLVKDELDKKNLNIITIDGVRIEFKDGWGLIRASNTQPVLVLRFEANTKQRLNEIQSSLEETVRLAINKC